MRQNPKMRTGTNESMPSLVRSETSFSFKEPLLIHYFVFPGKAKCAPRLQGQTLQGEKVVQHKGCFNSY